MTILDTFDAALADLNSGLCDPDRLMAINRGIAELTEQRDRARSIAVALEQENALLRASLNQTGQALLDAVEA